MLGYAIILYQIPQPQNYEDLGIKSILLFIITLLIAAVIYLYKSKEQTLKEKDAQLIQIIKEHSNDVKEFKNDIVGIIDRYHKFTEQIREVAQARRNG